MKIMKKIVFFFVAVMFFLIPVSVMADDASPTVQKNNVYVGRVLLEDKKFPLSHYKIETKVDSGIMATGDRAFASLNDGLWSLNKQIANFSIYAVEQLMTFNLISQLADQAAIISENIYSGMSGIFASLFLVIAGGTAYIYYHNQQTARAIKALVGALLISVATYWFFSNTSGNIKWINQLGSDIEGEAISTNVMLSTESLNNDKPKDAQESAAILRNQLFNLMVKKPYLLLNYGTTQESDIVKEDPNRIDNLLAVKPYGDEPKSKRADIVNAEVRDYKNVRMTTDYSMERFGEIFLTILLTIVISIPVLAMAGMKFLLQLFLLVALIFTAIPLVMSLLPTFADTATHHFKRIMGLIFHKAALSLIISVALGISTLIYETTNLSSGLEGYTLMVFLTTLIMWGIFKYRSEILEVVSMGYVTSNNMAERITQSATHTIKDSASKGFDLTKRVTESFRSRHRENGDQQEREQSQQPRFTVVQGGNKSTQSSSRQMPSGDQTSQDRSQRIISSNSSDKQGGALSPSRSQTGTVDGKNEAQNSKGLKINDWTNPPNRSAVRMETSEQRQPSESRQPAAIQQEIKTDRVKASEPSSQIPVSPARFQQPMSSDYPPETAATKETNSPYTHYHKDMSTITQQPTPKGSAGLQRKSEARRMDYK